ncbi:hypothetical protein KIPB_007066 [Kipferlia bialata]|uniref:Leucine-rich repeat-containing protein n=1 Tax=Kipferlia bialata TaxID=797122 RepID=A0A9K3GJN3_9EUKA|nr:hypothetical protein KIPB_007066 [Kipferlia bialata]|eukprot:g7066.t1
MATLSKHLVLSKTRKSKLSDVVRLNIWGNGLQDVSILRQMSNVEILSLSVNAISSLEPFTGCLKLQELYLRRNNIPSLQDVNYLRHLESLRILWLGENPCCESPHYRDYIIKALPRLTKAMSRHVSLDQLLNTRDNPIWLEEVDIEDGGSDKGFWFRPCEYGHNTVLNKRDSHTYRVDEVEGRPAMVKDRLITQSAELSNSRCSVGIGNHVFVQTRTSNEPFFRLYMWERDSDTWTECVGPASNAMHLDANATISRFQKELLVPLDSGRFCTLDTDSMKCRYLPENPLELKEGSEMINQPFIVGDSVLFVYGNDDGDEDYICFSESDGWTRPLQDDLPFFNAQCNVPVHKSTLCVGFDDGEYQIGYLDGTSQEFVECCETDFCCYTSVRLAEDLYLVSCFRRDVKYDGDAYARGGAESWYLLHLDLGMIQERGGVLTQDMFGE